MSAGLSVLSAGMVTAVGLNRASSCAAMRGRLDGFRETRFIGQQGEWQVGAAVPLPREWIGERRLAHLAAGAIVDALRGQDVGKMLVVLCLAEDDRPGRPVGDGDHFARRMLKFSGLPETTRVQIAAHGRPSGFVALRRAEDALKAGDASHVLIVGVDSLLTAAAISHFSGAARLLGPDTANGFLPGEAAAAILCAGDDRRHFALSGLGMSREEAFIYNHDDLPLRGDGMTQAYKQALDEAGTDLAGIEYRIADLSGEQYFFKQTALAALRLERGRKEFQDLWSPCESLGNIGAAVVPLMVGQALTAYEKGYDPGSPVLIESGNDDGACGAAVFHAARAA